MGGIYRYSNIARINLTFLHIILGSVLLAAFETIEYYQNLSIENYRIPSKTIIIPNTIEYYRNNILNELKQYVLLGNSSNSCS